MDEEQEGPGAEAGPSRRARHAVVERARHRTHSRGEGEDLPQGPRTKEEIRQMKDPSEGEATVKRIALVDATEER